MPKGCPHSGLATCEALGDLVQGLPPPLREPVHPGVEGLDQGVRLLEEVAVGVQLVLEEFSVATMREPLAHRFGRG